MKKLNSEPYYKPEPWTITEAAFKVETNHHNETIFALGNGYMGVRGTLEEDYSGPAETTTPGIYINGVYGSEQILYDEEPPQQPQKTQTILNLGNWTMINLCLDGEKFDILQGEVDNYQRVLNMKEGKLERSLIWTSPSGKKVRIQTSRLLSFTDQHLGVIKYSVIPLNFSGAIKIVSAIEGNVRNQYHFRERKAVKVLDRDISQDNGYIIQKVDSTDISVGISIKNQLEVLSDAVEVNNFIEGEKVLQEFNFDVEVDQEIVLYKYASFYTSLDCNDDTQDGKNYNSDYKNDITLECNGKKGSEKGLKVKSFKENQNEGNKVRKDEIKEKELKEKVVTAVENAAQKGYRQILSEQQEYLADYWDDVDVQIEGDLALQQAFRYNALNLLQSTGIDGRTNAAAKGLTGEFYEGHYFWDTETYILPFFLYNKPEVARSLLIYRYNNLDKARKNAERVRVDGALFPWRTINGEEASSYYMGSTIQFHIDADIAYSIKQYLSVTKDDDFLYNFGAEILFETARMWASRGSYIELLDNKFCINEVCGPDEYKPGVNNNCYTNYMAKLNLEFAIETYKKMEREAASKLEQLIEKISLAEEEINNWQKATDKMYLPFNEELAVHPQDDSFLKKDPIDIDSIPDQELPLVANWHPLAIWRYQLIKQADVIMLMLLLGDQFSIEQKKANYDYYEPKTTHDSSLSPSMYSIIASEIGYIEDAYNYFTQTARLDLDDYNENAYKGVHLACMGSAWMVLVQGFAGMRNYQGELHFKPYLPEKWDSYQFKIKFRNSRLRVKVSTEDVCYQLLSGEELSIVHNQQEITVDADGIREKLRKLDNS